MLKIFKSLLKTFFKISECFSTFAMIFNLTFPKISDEFFEIVGKIYLTRKNNQPC